MFHKYYWYSCFTSLNPTAICEHALRDVHPFESALKNKATIMSWKRISKEDYEIFQQTMNGR